MTESSFKTFILYQSNLNSPFIDSIHKPNTKGYYYNTERMPVQYHLYDGLHNVAIDSVDTHCDFIFFYEDSTVFIYTDIMKHFDSIQSIVSEKYFEPLSKHAFKNLGEHGYYSVKDSAIFLTVYFHDGSRFHTWIKEEWQMNINDNSDTLLLTRTTCKQCKNQYSGYDDKSEIVFDPPKKFAFVPISVRPDSTLPSHLLKKR